MLLHAILLAATPYVIPRAAKRHRGTGAMVDPLSLYSTRAKRRAALIMELHLLELRKQHLERVRAVIEKRLPVDDLLLDH